VVDNDSEDNSVQMVKKEFKWVNLIESKENNGFSAGNNLALKNSTAKYVMLLNSDVEFNEKSNLDLLIKFMNSNSLVAVITPKVILPNGKLDFSCHRGEPTIWASLSYFLGMSKKFPNKPFFAEYHQTYKNLDEAHEIDACSGAAMLVRTSKMKTVGLLDERFFMYAEDLDWCKRFRDDGNKIMYFPQVEVVHHKYKSGIKSSSSKTSTKVRVHFYDTMIQYFDKHYRDQYHPIVRKLIRYFLFIKKGGF
jgi:GT2 family glycosyltransferase